MEVDTGQTDSRDFDLRVKEHMVEYKRSVLKINQDGIWKRNKRPYKHILPEESWQANILEPYREAFFNGPQAKIQFHNDFHHLNSSQAMCINFFYPLIAEEKLHLLLPILGMDQTAKDCIAEACFEKESNLEIAKGRKTSFDFYMQLKPNTKIFFEIKYSENGFGKAAKDDEHLSNYYKVYKPLLNNNPAIRDNCKNEEYFLNHYQIMRNLLHIDANSTVVFIYPQDNQKVNEEALQARAEVMTPGWESKFILYQWEGLLRELFKHLKDKQLIDYYNAFADKYLKY